MYIFPGLGLAASVGGIKRITDKMLYTAAVACADAMSPADYAEGRSFPNIQNIREGYYYFFKSIQGEGVLLTHTPCLTAAVVQLLIFYFCCGAVFYCYIALLIVYFFCFCFISRCFINSCPFYSH
jgi:hypothetical protein